MAVSPFDSALYRKLFTHEDAARLFTDTAEIRAMMLVEGALAKAQGALGIIPETSAAAIHRASLELQIDPAALAEETGRNGVPVPALVAAFRQEMQAPDHAQFLHWGATSQDIVDTALVLRLRRALDLVEADLRAALSALASLAETHAETPMAGRTYGQAAAPTGFGAVVAGWGGPLLRHLDRLEAVRTRCLCVSLSGAAGTSAVWGNKAEPLRAALAEALDLADPGDSWHATRDRVAEIAAWLEQVCVSGGKMGRDLTLLTQTGIEEVTLGMAGASSTMPQKKNPVGPAVLEALANAAGAMRGAVSGAGAAALQRDGAAWFTEWLTLPQLVVSAARSAELMRGIGETIVPDTGRMARAIETGSGTIHAEALTFALARKMPRPEAAAEIKALCAQAAATGEPLATLFHAAHPEIDIGAVLDTRAQLGEAPSLARRFARQARARQP